MGQRWMVRNKFQAEEFCKKINTMEVNEVYEHLSRLLAEKYSIDVRFGRKR